MKIPVISLAILGGQAAWAYSRGSDTYSRISNFASLYSGYSFISGQWQPQNLALGYGPWIVKRFVGAIAKPRVPLKGLPISMS